MMSTGSMSMYTDAQVAYRREQIGRDFAASNGAVHQRADRRALAAEARAAARPASTPTSDRHNGIVRWLRTARPAAH